MLIVSDANRIIIHHSLYILLLTFLWIFHTYVGVILLSLSNNHKNETGVFSDDENLFGSIVLQI